MDNQLYLPYSFHEQDGQKVVKMFCDPPQIMTASELSQWMKELRDTNPPLYAEVVPIYIKLRKTNDARQ